MKRIDKVVINAITNNCPIDLFVDNTKDDQKTRISDERGNMIGCRGITCEECWNKEIEEK